MSGPVHFYYKPLLYFTSLNNGLLNICCGSRRLRAVCVASLLLPSIYLFTNAPQYRYTPLAHMFEATGPAQPGEETIPPGYLIWSPVCRIPDIDPLEESSMRIFKYKEYVPCSNHRITYVIDDQDGHGVLYINSSALDEPLANHEYISCCYSNVTRPKIPVNADTKIVKSTCIEFNSSTILLDTEEFVVTKCIIKNRKLSKEIFEDAHTNVQVVKELSQRSKALSQNLTNNPWNILIIGIDTLSRINLARAMPKTHNFLTKNSWIDFQGYNKIDDNTYPNLMAFLTGRNQTRARIRCDRTGKFSPDNCDFVWKRYEEAGYVTAYGEDYVGIDTFGKPLHKGFNRQPTNHYMRPLFKASEKFTKTPSGNKLHCTGGVTSGEALFNYALDFAKKYEDHPFFGLFWANTFSHDDVTSPSRMDSKMLNFFERLKTSGTLNRTIVLFISDHGIRFGKLRATLTGYYEERLPALYMWFPLKFRELHPAAYNSILVNTKHLTSPYDVYMTLQDVLHMSMKTGGVSSPSEACSSCQSLFHPVPWNRTCEDAGILAHWCTCSPLKSLPINHEIGMRAIQYVFDVEIEKILSAVNKIDCRICAKLGIGNVLSIRVYDYLNSNSFDDYLLVFSTSPGNMLYETTVRHHLKSDQFVMNGIISRLTGYAGKGRCVKTDYLKKYCYCTKKCNS
ncbi:uncharacterized protein LOC143919899 isoform X1 [Arctopsyche grandis]|uniref:uncharacterized protein LOC143919899 isoform X1 n=2 Tax=Arctopsyche grandis TaxID=121162 RepID=UPI00406DA32D